MIKIVLDYDAILQPGPAKQWAAANGYELVGLTRYLWGSSISLCGGDASGYAVSAATRQWLHDMTTEGLGVICNWELAANAPDYGSSQGQSDATAAVACMDALGAPRGAGIYYSNDAIVSSLPSVVRYYQTAAQVTDAHGYECEIYGQASVFQAVQMYNVKKLWKASDGTNDQPPGTVMVQQGPSSQVVVDGITCDLDIVTADDLSAWNLSGFVPPRVVPPPAVPKGACEVNLALIEAGSDPRAIRSLHGVLTAWGYKIPNDELNVGGEAKWGPETTKAVADFQKDRRITPATHFGPLSYGAAFPFKDKAA